MGKRASLASTELDEAIWRIIQEPASLTKAEGILRLNKLLNKVKSPKDYEIEAKWNEVGRRTRKLKDRDTGERLVQSVTQMTLFDAGVINTPPLKPHTRVYVPNQRIRAAKIRRIVAVEQTSEAFAALRGRIISSAQIPADVKDEIVNANDKMVDRVLRALNNGTTGGKWHKP